MQWSAAENAGFSTGKPWIMVNPNYTSINAEAQLADPDSVFHYYKKLIALRRSSKWTNVIVYGSYALLAPQDTSVFAYTREKDVDKLLVICNMTDKDYTFTVPTEVSWSDAELVIGSNAPAVLERELKLAPWSASVWAVK